MSYPRHAGISNPADETSQFPDYRAMGFMFMSLPDIRNMFARWGKIVELDATWSITGTLYDPTGTTLTMVTEVNEFGGVLNIGSHLVDYIVRVLLPPETGVKTSLESFIEVKRSRCQLPDYLIESTRRRLQEQQTQTQSQI